MSDAASPVASRPRRLALAGASLVAAAALAGLGASWASGSRLSELPKGPVLARVIERIIDTVDRRRLRWTGRRGEREVRVTAGFYEHRYFVIDAAPAAIRPAVVQSPIPMDKSIGDSSRAVPLEEPVFVVKSICELR